jgi:serine/threonine-protein kinase
MTELVGRTLANYRILEVVGQGGMATVYRALDLRADRDVAIKVLSPYVAADPKFRGRFDREVNLLQRLSHPNIVPILAFGQADGFHYIVMPYLSSGTLHERLRAGPLLPLEGGRIVAQVASALAFAHEQGVVHRDIKPSNILMDADGKALLTDFGFAHVPWESASLTGSLLIGTPAYMSPEQCRGEDVGPKSDQYSLGVVLYQLCTGRLPYEADTPMGVVIKQASQPLPPPRLANPNLPFAVEEVLVKVLSKEPSSRYESVAALNEAFQGALKASLDPSGTYRLRQLRAEHPTEQLPRRVVLRGLAREGVRRARRLAPLLVGMFLLGCPAGAWALGILPPLGGDPAGLAQAAEGASFRATIDSLSTLNAPGEGTLAVPGAIETAVYATVAAIAAPGENIALVKPGEGDLLATLGPTPSPTVTPIGYRTPTPTKAPNTPLPGEPSWTPAATPTITLTSAALPTTPVSSPTAAVPTQAPTNTPVPPTNTPVPPTNTPQPPPPTSTPRDINPNACKSDPGHPNYCTPTP